MEYRVKHRFFFLFTLVRHHLSTLSYAFTMVVLIYMHGTHIQITVQMEETMSAFIHLCVILNLSSEGLCCLHPQLDFIVCIKS